MNMTLPLRSCLVLWLFLLTAPALMAARTQATPSDSLQTELDAVNLQIDYLKLKVKQNNAQIDNFEKRIQKQRLEIKKLEEQIAEQSEFKLRLDEQINHLKKENQQNLEQMRALLTQFRARLVQLHKIKQSTLLGSIFSAKNLNSFLNRFQMVKYLLENDKVLLTQMKAKQKKLQQGSDELEQKQQQLETVQAELEQKRSRVQRENASLQALMKTVVLEKKLFLEREKKLASARQELEKTINQVENERQNNSIPLDTELQKKPVTKKQSAQSQTLPKTAPDAARLMKFSWPADTENISRAYQSGDEKTAALMIQLNGETEIIAAGRGKVLYKGQISGLGNVIILGHDRGFSTVYANLNDMWVGMGEIIEQGDTIGKQFGGDRALHFEIRFGGKKQLPATYLPQIKQLEIN